MAFASTGTAPNIIITQTGTDTSLAGLSGVAGVSIAYSNGRVEYRVAGGKLVVSGALSYSTGALVFGEDCPDSTVEVNNGGVLSIGTAAVGAPARKLAVLDIRKAATNGYSNTGLSVYSGGTMKNLGGVVRFAAPVRINAGATSVLDGDFCAIPTALGDGARFFQASTGVTFGRNFLLTGSIYQFSYPSSPMTAGRLSSPDGGIAMLFGGNAPITDPVRLRGIDIDAAAPSIWPGWGYTVWECTDFASPRNVGISSNSGTTNAYTLLIWRISVAVTATLSGAPLTDAVVQFIPRNDGARKLPAYTVRGGTFDEDAHAAAQGASVPLVAGSAALERTVGVYSFNESVSPAGRSSWYVTGTTAEFAVKGYGCGITPASVSINAIGGKTLTVPTVLDAAVSRTASAAGALTAVSTLDDVYDVLKLWGVQSINAAYPTALTQAAVSAGGVLDIGSHSLVLDPAAPAVVGISGGVITVKGAGLAVGVKHASIKSTGTVTATAGAVITSPIVDANGNSYLSFQGIDSWVVYSNPQRTAQIGAGSGSALFRFVYALGVTYYLKCIAGSTEFAMVATPMGVGNTQVTLSTQALLTTLQAKVAEVKGDTADIKVATGLIKVTVL
ncbi:hypothetical protein UFOVP60_16 [uncultured Caudovirales phage]|uniref:Uncharacterized protein n=1 Tax=uncultured Caudovirales phage TaxID=2100421 RepID=A0A6J5T8Z5_9CAUD|nr:hypothetical protein UFOVP60_16 [uncultured Caudovirales phage]